MTASLEQELNKGLAAGIPPDELKSWVQAALQLDNGRHRRTQDNRRSSPTSVANVTGGLQNDVNVSSVRQQTQNKNFVQQDGRSNGEQSLQAIVHLPTLDSLLNLMEEGDVEEDVDDHPHCKIRQKYTKKDEKDASNAQSHPLAVRVTFLNSAHQQTTRSLSEPDSLLNKHAQIDTADVEGALKKLFDHFAVKRLREKGLKTLLTAAKKEGKRAITETELLKKAIASHEEEKIALHQVIEDLQNEIALARRQTEDLARETYLSTRYQANMPSKNKRDIKSNNSTLKQINDNSRDNSDGARPHLRGRESVRLMEAIRIALDELALEDAVLRAEEAEAQNSIFNFDTNIDGKKMMSEDELSATPIEEGAEDRNGVSPIEEQSVVVVPEDDLNSNPETYTKGGNSSPLPSFPSKQAIDMIGGGTLPTANNTNALSINSASLTQRKTDIGKEIAKEHQTIGMKTGKEISEPKFNVMAAQSPTASPRRQSVLTPPPTVVTEMSKIEVKDNIGINASNTNHHHQSSLPHQTSLLVASSYLHSPTGTLTEHPGRTPQQNTRQQRVSNFQFPTSAGTNGAPYFGAYTGSSGGLGISGSRGTIRSGRFSSTGGPNDLKSLELQKNVDDLSKNNKYLRSRCDEVHRQNKVLQMAALDHHDQLSHYRQKMEVLQEQMTIVLRNTDAVLAQKSKQMMIIEQSTVPQLRQTVSALEAQVSNLQEGLASAHKELFTLRMQTERDSLIAAEKINQLEKDKAAAELKLAKREVALSAIPRDPLLLGFGSSLDSPLHTVQATVRDGRDPNTATRLTRPKVLLEPLVKIGPINALDRGGSNGCGNSWETLVQSLNADIAQEHMLKLQAKGPPRKSLRR